MTDQASNLFLKGLASTSLFGFYERCKGGMNIRMCAVGLISIALTLINTSCSKPETPIPIEYTGPLSVVQNVERLYTENEILKVRLLTPKIIEMQNGDYSLPEGVYLEFYNEQGKIASTLRANTAYYYKSENKWRGQGKVEVKNIEKNQQLNTEELFWKPDTEKIFTDKFVTIKLQTEVIYGTGLDAAQDMSSYTITNPEGVFEVEE